MFRQTGDRWTYSEFARLVDRLCRRAACARRLQGRPHRHLVAEPAEWLLAQFATARIGAILVNINPAYRTTELEYALNKVGCKSLIVAPQFKASDYMAMLEEIAPELKNCPPGHLQCDNACRS